MADDLGFVPAEASQAPAQTTAPDDLGFVPSSPDTSQMKSYVKENIAKAKAENKEKPVEAQSFLDAFEAGLQISTAGLAIRGKTPDKVLPEHADSAMQIISSVGTLAGDVPAMFAGGVMGEFTPAGPIGAAAGTFALPAALRKMMMDHYERGDITTGKEFFNRLAGTTWETIKGGTIGALTSVAGKTIAPAVEKVAGKVLSDVASQYAGRFSGVGAEVATMTTVGAALEGHLPNSQDFLNAGIVVGGLHAVGSAAPKLREYYSKTGERPEALVETAQSDPPLKQDLMSQNPKGLVESEVVDQHPVVNSEFSRPFDVVSGADHPETVPVLKEQPQLKAPSTWNNFYQNFTDDLDPVKLATQDLNLAPSKDPYKLMRLYRDYQGKVVASYNEGTLDFKTLEVNGEGLKQIFKDVPNTDHLDLTEHEAKVLSRIPEVERAERGNSWGKFTSYLMAERAIELEGRGIKTGIDAESAKNVVEANKASYAPIAERLYDYQNRMVDYAVDAGVLSPTSADAMKYMNENYVPFYRLVDEADVKGKGAAKPFKKIEGSEREILDPITSIYKNTAAIIKLSEQNRALKALADLDLDQKAKNSATIIKVTDKEITKALEDQGIHTEELGDDIKGFSIFRHLQKDLKDNQYMLFKNGKPEVRETSPEIAEAIRSLNYHPGLTNVWAKAFLEMPAKALRIGVTLPLDFTARNFFRDQLTASVYSKYQQVPFMDAMISMKHMWAKDEPWSEYLRSGGVSGSFAEMTKYLKEDVWGLNKETGFMDRAWNIVASPIKAMGAISELTENVTRFSEFRRSGAIGGTLDQKIDGAYAAREVTVDFLRAGAKVRGMWSAITPFMNVGAQGTDRMIRAFKENPAGFAAKATASITIPTMLAWWANKDDSRYKDAPGWEKDLFWIFPTDKWEIAGQQEALGRPSDLRRQKADGSWEVNNGSVFRLPKPFEIGILYGSLVERSLDAFYNKDPDKFKDFTTTMVQGLVPNLIPAVASAPIEHMFNKSFFTGNQVVSQSVEQYLPAYQYTEYTSETAKQIGKIVSHIPYIRDIGPRDAKLASPMVIDNYIRDWSGTTGQYVLNILDSAIGTKGYEKPAPSLADIPFVKAFVMRYPQASLQNIEDFRQQYSINQATIATVSMLAKSGDIRAAQGLAEANPADMARLGSINQALSKQNAAIRNIYKSPDMNKDEKRQLIDSIYYQMSQTATRGNQIIKETRKALGIAN